MNERMNECMNEYVLLIDLPTVHVTSA